MGTTAQKLQAVLDSKSAIKAALVSKGKNPSDVLSEYAGLIETITDISPGIISYEASPTNVPIYIEATATDGSRIVVITTNNGRAAYSDDCGQSWNTFTLSQVYDYKDMIYAKGKFICVAAAQENVIWSADGTTWNEASLGYSGDWQSIAYGNGTYVAICKNTNQAAYSVDGTDWSLSVIPKKIDWRAIRWCKDRFIAVAKDSTYAAYSYDGVGWTIFTLPESAPWCDVAYGNGRYIAIAGGDEYVESDTIAYTDDVEAEWSTATLPEAYNYQRIAYNNGVWILSTKTGHFLYSYDGLNWTDIYMNMTISLQNIVYQNGVFIIFPSCNSAQEAVIVTTKLPPEDAKYLGNALPEEVPCGVTFTSIHGIGLEGTKSGSDEQTTYVLTNADGTQSTLALLSGEQTVVPTATANDIRVGTTAITNDGYTEGTKEIPSYYSRYGTVFVQANTEAILNVPEYDYKNLMVSIAPYNLSINESTAINYVSVESAMYEAKSTTKIADITIDTVNEQVNLGVTVNELSVLRYFIVREEV